MIQQPPIVTGILKALGLEGQRVRSLDLHMAVNELVTVEAEMLPTAGQIEAVTDEMKKRRFVLTEIAEDEASK